MKAGQAHKLQNPKSWSPFATRTLLFATRIDVLKQLAIDLRQRVAYNKDQYKKGGYSIYTHHTTNSVNAGMYGKNPMLKYAEEYTANYFNARSRFRFIFDADLKTERQKVATFLEDVCRYGDPCVSARTAKSYMTFSGQ